MLHQVHGFDQIARLSSLTTDIGGLVHELQKERGASSVVLSSQGKQFRTGLLAQRTSTGRLLVPLARRKETIFTEPGSRLASKLAVAEADLDRLSRIRERIDALDIAPSDSFSYFTTTIADLLDVVLESGAAAQEPAATRTFLALFDLMQAKERAGQERATGAQGFAAGRFSPALFENFRHLKDEQDSFLRIFASYATQDQSEVLLQQLADPANAEVGRLRGIALAGGLDGQLAGVDGPTWFAAATLRIDLLRSVEVTLARELEASAHREARSAEGWLALEISGVLALVGLTGALSLATGRALARPIQRMTQAMTALAAGDTTVAMPGHTQRNEIGAMAAAVEVFRANTIVRGQREAQIAHMARHDALTNLPNRTSFQERLEHVVTLTGRGGAASVFCIDLDGFKSVNDTLGHFAGDQLLRIVAERMQACLRETDMVARFGGDEFAIVQIGGTRPDDAHILADRLLNIVGEPLEIEGQRLKPRMSIGIATSPLDGTSAETLLKNADIALYRAKFDGGHSYRFFEAEMEARLQARRQLEADLHQAMASQAFELFYQPVVDARTGAVTGFEALVRWLHPTRGRVSPADFIPVAEETGLIVPLGEWILERACADAVSWPEPLSVAVNLSPVQFKDRNLVDKVHDVMARSGLDPRRLELEITESVLLHDDEMTIRALHALRALDVRISMDDFGTGYSSLRYLRSFPFDKIKIDQSFIRGLGVTDDADAIVRAITMLGNSLGIPITAEGVETPAQRARLRAEGCNLLQGYLFSPPRPAAEVATLIEELSAQSREEALI